MFDTITIALACLTLSALAAAVFAVTSLSGTKKRLSELGLRVLESEDIGKIKEAADKAETYESRMDALEKKADGNQNQIAEHTKKLSELAEKLQASEQKMASFDVRSEELSTNLGSVEQTANKNEDDLAQTVTNIKALADEIQSIKQFQTATEKIHGLIQAAFGDIQADMPPEQVPVTTPEAATHEDDSQEYQEWQEETKDPKMTGSRRWQF